jgi:uncharacterized protein YgiM (DUF1202 family)
LFFVCQLSFAAGIGNWMDNHMFGESIGDQYIEQMNRIDRGARFLWLTDSYINIGRPRNEASELALYDYDASLASQIFQEIASSDKSYRETMKDVSYIMFVAANRIYEYYRPPPPPVKYNYVSSDVNMRSGPSTETDIVTILHKGDRVEIVTNNENLEGWVKISFNGQIGYVKPNYLR